MRMYHIKPLPDGVDQRSSWQVTRNGDRDNIDRGPEERAEEVTEQLGLDMERDQPENPFF